MKIVKVRGKTEESILEEIHNEYGTNVLVLSSNKEKQPGLLGLLKAPHYVVTIAINEQIEETIATRGELFEEKNQQLLEQLIEQKATKKLLMDLKDQVGELQGELKSIAASPSSKEVEVSTEKVELKQTTKELVKGTLRVQGVEEEVLEILFETVQPEDTIEEIATILYKKMGSMLVEETKEIGLAKKVYFVGSTGVGKTTTIAKLTAYYGLSEHKKIGLFTADTYRIAAIEQLKTYADILEVPIETICSKEDVGQFEQKYAHLDCIFVDTAGRSHKNVEQMQELKELLQATSEKTIFLVLNMNTSWRELKAILDTYAAIITDFSLIITKLDEAEGIGNLLNIAYYAARPIAYVTNGQNVPNDFKVFKKVAYMKQLLGGDVG